MDMPVVSYAIKRKRMCPNCKHRHRENIFCHMYCKESYIDEEALNIGFADDDDYEEEIDIDVKDNSNSNNENNQEPTTITEMLALIEKKKNLAMLHRRPLATPIFVESINYKRCNCKVGVPSNNRKYEPIATVAKLNDIRLMYYDEIMEKFRNSKLLFDDPYEVKKKKRENYIRIQSEFSLFLPVVTSYLRIHECNNIAPTCSYWNNGIAYCRDYVDVRDCIPYLCYKPHSGPVESLMIYDNKLFSGGDRRIIASDYRTGNVLATVARSSGEVPCIASQLGELYFSDVNGAVRSSQITFDPKNMIPGKTHWEHSRSVTKIIWSLPTNGPCETHAIINHICFMFTCSEDRSMRVWSTSTYDCVKVIDTKSLRSLSLLTMAQSGRHIFVGTTGGKIPVFSKFNVCERDDVHNCSMGTVDKSYCLQITLKLPPIKMASGHVSNVTSLLCCGPNYQYDNLWAGDSVGYLTLWQVPRRGLDFKPLKSFQAHNLAIRGLANTWRHLITISDDGHLLLHELSTLVKIRKLNVLEYCMYRNILDRYHIPRKLKSLCIKEDIDNDGSGVVVIGTSQGEIIVLPLGNRV